MGDIVFTGKKNVQVNAKDVSWISRQMDLVFGANKGKSNQQANDGVDLLIGQAPEPETKTFDAEVIDVYFAVEKKDAAPEKITSASIGDDVLLVLKTKGLAGKVVALNLRDTGKIISGQEKDTLGVLQDGTYTQGILRTTIDKDETGIIKIRFKGETDAVTGNWLKGIVQSDDKFVRLRVLVDVRSGNPTTKTKYHGTHGTNFWFDSAELNFQLHLPVCKVDPAVRSHFVIHNTAGNMSETSIKSHTNWDDPKKKKRSKAHKYIMSDGSIIEIWPFTEKNVWATKLESKKQLKGQMFHVELNYAESPAEAHYTSLVDLYLEATGVEGCWPTIVPHIEVDRGIADGHSDPNNFDYNKFYELLKAESIPIDKIPKFEHDRYWGNKTYKVPWDSDKTNWPPVLSGNPHK